jgi:undecaprenyl-diphosphatase
MIESELFPGLIVVLLLLTLWLLHIGVQNHFFVSFDQKIAAWFHAIRHTQLDGFFSTVTWMGSLWILLPLYIAIILVFQQYNPSLEKLLGITFFGTIITTYVLKYTLDRPRPHFYAMIEELPLDPSFPSAHSAQIAAFSLGILLAVSHNTGMFTFLAIVLGSICIFVFTSRIYLQVHFPTDVIAGILVALMWGVISYWIVYKGGIQ